MHQPVRPLERSGRPTCRPDAHRHLRGVCARCGVSDDTVAQTITASGVPWPPTCSYCSAKVSRIRAVERAGEGW